jgi:DNA ligase-associated metallophosphoesterase
MNAKKKEINSINLKIGGEDLVLLPDKSLYWKRNDTLIIADAHFGKVSHFRNRGFAVSSAAADDNFERLEIILHTYNPQKFIFLGDVFHSDYNREWNRLVAITSRRWRKTEFILVPGNHDVLKPELYAEANINLSDELLQIHSFTFSHHPLGDSDLEDVGINIAGHLHPGVRLRGPAKQYTKLPCFYYQNGKQLILPAFGSFTGLCMIDARRNDRIFVVVDRALREIPVE